MVVYAPVVCTNHREKSDIQIPAKRKGKVNFWKKEYAVAFERLVSGKVWN